MDDNGSTRNATTIYTLAELAGVSPATVSRALNDDPLINAKTRGAIKSLARKQGYRKSAQAANLSRGRTGIIAVLLPTIANPIYAQLAGKLIERAQSEGLGVSLHYAELDPARERRILQEFLKMPADGFVIAAEHQASMSAIEKLAHRGKPIVLRQNVGFEHDFDSVFVDFEKGAYEATKYLIGLGHRVIRAVGKVGDTRLGKTAGFLRAMSEAGLDASKASFFDIAPPSMEQAYRSSLDAFRNQRPTALLAYSDYLAFGVLRALSELGLKVPQDVSVVSMDNIEFAAYGPCPLTTMAQPVDAQAEALLSAVLERLKKTDRPRVQVKLDLELVIRGSSVKTG